MKKTINISIRLFRLLLFILFYFKELLLSGVLLARDIIRPKKTFTHGIIRIGIDISSPTALMTLVNMVSMTPGSLIIELTPDHKYIYVHVMYLEDPESFERNIKEKFEKRIKRIFE